MLKICILGKDNRSNELRKIMAGDVEFVHYSKADYIISPIPFTRDNVYLTDEEIKVDELIFAMKKNDNSKLITGAINNISVEKLNNNKINYVYIMKSEEFVQKNALATAEGTIDIIMQNTLTTIQNSNILIIGYGRISKKLAYMLKALGANITIVSRREETIKDAFEKGYISKNVKELANIVDEYEVIVNTVPAIVINKNVLENINKETLIIDLASGVGGIDYIEAKKQEKNTIWALSIPSKYSPKSAAKYLKEEITRIINNNGI